MASLEKRIEKLEQRATPTAGWFWQMLAKCWDSNFEGTDKQAIDFVSEMRQKQADGNYHDNYKSPMQ